MKRKKLVSLLLVALMVFTLVACSSSGGGSGAANKPSPVGKYVLTGMEENGEATSQEDLDLLKSLGLTVTMEIKEDGTGSMDLFGEALEFTWDADNIILEGEKQAYTFDGSKFTIENDGTKMEFTISEGEN